MVETHRETLIAWQKNYDSQVQNAQKEQNSLPSSVSHSSSTLTPTPISAPPNAPTPTPTSNSNSNSNSDLSLSSSPKKPEDSQVPTDSSEPTPTPTRKNPSQDRAYSHATPQKPRSPSTSKAPVKPEDRYAGILGILGIVDPLASPAPQSSDKPSSQPSSSNQEAPEKARIQKRKPDSPGSPLQSGWMHNPSQFFTFCHSRFGYSLFKYNIFIVILFFERISYAFEIISTINPTSFVPLMRSFQ